MQKDTALIAAGVKAVSRENPRTGLRPQLELLEGEPGAARPGAGFMPPTHGAHALFTTDGQDTGKGAQGTLFHVYYVSTTSKAKH